METILTLLPAACIAGMGAMLCAMGYKLIRFHAQTFGCIAMAAAGALAGAWFESPLLATGLCAVGAVGGYFLAPVFFYGEVAIAGALGGALIGYVTALGFSCGHPLWISGATAAGTGAIALLNARPLTILWTACTGATMVYQGAVLSIGSEEPQSLAFSIACMAIFLVGGMVFQVRTTRESALTTRLAPVNREAKPETARA